MPTYVYKFIDTGETIEVQQSFEDAALTEAVHPTTGATMAVKKVFLPVGITFKGDGFYKTDSRSGRSSAGSSGASTASASSSSESSSESSSGSPSESASTSTASTSSSSDTSTSTSSSGSSGSTSAASSSG